MTFFLHKINSEHFFTVTHLQKLLIKPHARNNKTVPNNLIGCLYMCQLDTPLNMYLYTCSLSTPSFNDTPRTSLPNVHMNMHGMYNYLSFAWPFQPVVLDVLHWYIAWDRIWLRLHRAYKLETCVNGSSSLLYTRLSILALELPRGFHREQNGREQPLKRSKYYLKPTKIQYYFSKVLGPNLQFYLFCPEHLCRCRSGFFRPRRSEC